LARFGEGELSAEGRRALEAALGYFANFAPRHTADEEESLFPRLRRCAGPDASAARAELERLEEEHRWGETCHALVDRQVRAWLAAGRVGEQERTTLRQALDYLAAMYAGHIRREEEQLFVLAGRLLDDGQLHEIGEEMRRRRG
jgi:hemerythrin-like domain-containing protein